MISLGVDCGYPQSVDNAYVDGNRFTYENRIRYICYKGFRLVGDRTLYCTATGQWQGIPPVCESKFRLFTISFNELPFRFSVIASFNVLDVHLFSSVSLLPSFMFLFQR